MGDFKKGCGFGCGAAIGWALGGLLLFVVTIGGCVVTTIGGCGFLAMLIGDGVKNAAKNSRHSEAPSVNTRKTHSPRTENEVVKVTASPKESVSPKQTSVPETADVHKDPNIDRLNLINYERVKDGMTYDEVRCILGPASEELASSRIGQGTKFDTQTVILSWEGSWGANCNVTFQNGRVVAKAQFGLKRGEPTPDLESREAERARKAIEQRKQAEGERAKAEVERKAAIEAAKWRTWTDASGKHKTEAKYGGIAFGKVKLTKRDGTIIELPLDKLSDEDQEWIKNRTRRVPGTQN